MLEENSHLVRFKNAFELVERAKVFFKENQLQKAVEAYQQAVNEYRQYLVSLKYIEEDILQKINQLEKMVHRLKAHLAGQVQEKQPEPPLAVPAAEKPAASEDKEKEARRVIYFAKKAIDDLTVQVKKGLNFSTLKQKVDEIYQNFKKQLSEIFGKDSETVSVYQRWLDTLINDLQRIILERKTVEVKQVAPVEEKKAPASAKESAKPQAKEAKSKIGAGYKILLVDDEPDVILTLEFLLKSEGFSVFKAENGPDGLTLAVAEKPNLIILDIKMPGMNGHEVAQLIRENENLKNIPIIFLTAVSQVVDSTYGIKTEVLADRYISKPYDVEQFLKIIKEILKIK